MVPVLTALNVRMDIKTVGTRTNTLLSSLSSWPTRLYRFQKFLQFQTCLYQACNKQGVKRKGECFPFQKPIKSTFTEDKKAKKQKNNKIKQTIATSEVGNTSASLLYNSSCVRMRSKTCCCVSTSPTDGRTGYQMNKCTGLWHGFVCDLIGFWFALSDWQSCTGELVAAIVFSRRYVNQMREQIKMCFHSF